MNASCLGTLLTAALLIMTVFAMDADAQQGIQQFQCAGNINGIPSQVVLEISPAGNEGPGVAGQIRNQYADYLFSGILFGGNEGFVSLVERRTGERIDRVWIGIGQSGFALRTEDGAMYSFQCRV